MSMAKDWNQLISIDKAYEYTYISKHTENVWNAIECYPIYSAKQHYPHPCQKSRIYPKLCPFLLLLLHVQSPYSVLIPRYLFHLSLSPFSGQLPWFTFSSALTGLPPKPSHHIPTLVLSYVSPSPLLQKWYNVKI